MRALRFFFAASCLATGAVVGALNRDTVGIDLGPMELRATFGVTLLRVVLLGAVAGGAAVALGGASAGPTDTRKAPGPSSTEV